MLALVLMGVFGLRPGEAVGLCEDAVDLEAGMVSVIRAVQLQHGYQLSYTATN